MPGTYLNSFYETRPAPLRGERHTAIRRRVSVLINVTNGKIIRLLVDDEPFDVRYGELRRHERVLDFRAGVLRREAEWVSPAGQAIRLSTVRMVSLVHRAVAAILYEVEPLESGGHVRRAVRAGRERAAARRPTTAIRAPAPGPRRRAADPSPSQTTTLRVDARAPDEGQRPADGGGDGPRGRHTVRDDDKRLRAARTSAASRSPRSSQPGQRLRLVKFLAYGWSSQRSLPSVRDQVEAALAERPSQRLGRAWWRASASTSMTSGSASNVEIERRSRAPDRRSASPSFTCCRLERAPSSERSPQRD